MPGASPVLRRVRRSRGALLELLPHALLLEAGRWMLFLAPPRPQRFGQIITWLLHNKVMDAIASRQTIRQRPTFLRPHNRNLCRHTGIGARNHELAVVLRIFGRVVFRSWFAVSSVVATSYITQRAPTRWIRWVFAVEKREREGSTGDRTWSGTARLPVAGATTVGRRAATVTAPTAKTCSPGSPCRRSSTCVNWANTMDAADIACLQARKPATLPRCPHHKL